MPTYPLTRSCQTVCRLLCVQCACVLVLPLCTTGGPSLNQQVKILQNALGVGFGTSQSPKQTFITTRVRSFKTTRRFSGGGGWSRRRRRRRRQLWRPRPPPPPRRSPVTRHIAIVLDGSGSVGRHNFRVAVDDIASIFGKLCYKWTRYNQPSDVRLAFMIYSGRNRLVFNFQHSAGRHTSLGSIINDIRRARNMYPGGWTATGEALDYARRQIFTPDLLRRYPKSEKRLLIITDGRSNGRLNPGAAARRLHRERKVDIYPVGIANYNLKELVSMHQAKNSKLVNILLLSNFRAFSQIKSAVVQSKGECKKNVFGR